ncbi:cupin domain-containing protein [Aquabacterium sp. OR-4]|uniref:cupin domain-containing protein n=1 Tax=Aquabacterium sp. OR-4 TaxID=2978127 RepID=UPI0021B3047E|nr:cupin domain-containing protein [Aquabacterium sp. OR-4]MDT7838426.1 cupin domain-containing protein [Aquabacterium sp. OR-4]
MPKLDVTCWENIPEKINRLAGLSRGAFSELVLGDQASLSQFGVHIERLPPGSRSSFRHWHLTEDEFAYVLAGEVVLIEDDESLLRAGEAAAWKAGVPVGHCLENRTNADATVLVVGARAVRGVVHYSDHDLVMHHDEQGRRFCRKDGSPWPVG